MADYSGTRIGCQHTFNPYRSFRSSISDDYLPGVLAVAYADAASVMERNPGCTTYGVKHGVQQRPIADGIRSIEHPFSLSIG